ncbi:MAG TPA: S26 family signal peptidase [Candidatus Poseidoniales archaeon]|jgi:signal peptidase I|nr:MAG TPA: S26 family signal peptidase [Candidatus Poseidoniales archaeon]HIH57110.1 S26 family signal peptidase [Candidatus Poseidoniaceae archaeon]|tara:strand:+ start:4220 stop:5182 length:963 start_codon:yes stop_codon:yes gene_type:complete
MGEYDPMRTLVRELVLAAGMITLLVLAMWAHTGSMPPLVVVESNSMQHDSDGEIGTIDAGDLVLVHAPEDNRIVTFAEATDSKSDYYGYESLGMEGDVIIYERNGESDSTPIIHRALFEIVIGQSVPAENQDQCEGGVFWEDVCITSWSVPGSDQVNVKEINLIFDGENTGKYACEGIAAQHGSEWFSVENYTPMNPGYITLGDNNDCNDDQGVFEFAQGLSSIHSGMIRPVQEDWVIGISGAEIPWLGTVKLMVSGGDSPGVSQVPGQSFVFLILFVGAVLVAPIVIEPVIKRILRNSPEAVEAEIEDAIALIYSSEEE